MATEVQFEVTRRTPVHVGGERRCSRHSCCGDASWHLRQRTPRSLGISAQDRLHRVRTGRWLRVHDGVYRIAGAPITWRGDLLAACRAGGSRAVASHRSAAALWELPGAAVDLMEITCPRWRRARHDGLIVHETLVLGSADTTTVDHIPCTTIERTIFDMCGTAGPARRSPPRQRAQAKADDSPSARRHERSPGDVGSTRRGTLPGCGGQPGSLVTRCRERARSACSPGTSSRTVCRHRCTSTS